MSQQKDGGSGDGILELHFLSRFLGINSSLLRLEFSTLIFPFYKMLFMNRLEFSCFADFFVCIFKTRVEYGFLKNPPVEGTVNSIEQKTRVFCQIRLSKSFFPLFVASKGIAYLNP
jgi:hypothetical protein